ncbi:MAG: antibiotic biosynthesis monooxygenase [Sphaerobacter sp.]|nr:antibiotic biosynthesis monooxygenase [Sphaerobacter sp.]
MFGTVTRLKPKQGHIQHLIDMNTEWQEGHGATVEGFVGEYLFESERNPGEYLLVVLFDDRESYRANAADPEQDKWYRQMRQHLTEDPIWEDGEIIHAHSTGMMPPM